MKLNPKLFLFSDKTFLYDIDVIIKLLQSIEYNKMDTKISLEKDLSILETVQVMLNEEIILLKERIDKIVFDNTIKM